MKIHIFGASGSGVTTLGKNLSQHFHLPCVDGDDFYWRKTDPPFIEANPIEERKIVLKDALKLHASYVLSGSVISWAEFVKDDFDLAIYLYVPKEERLKRIKQREQVRFGNRIEAGGDMYDGHLKFLEWAVQYDEGIRSGRSKPRHEEWMKTLKCPVVKIEGVFTEQEAFEKALTIIKNFFHSNSL